MEYKLKDFVSTEKKVELIGLTIAEATTEGFVNPFVVNILLYVNTFLVYTNNDLTQEDKANKFDLYDKLQKENIDITELIGEEEIQLLRHYLDSWSLSADAYARSVGGAINSMSFYLEELSEKIGGSLDSLKNIDLSKLAQVIPLAKELGFDLEQAKEEMSK